MNILAVDPGVTTGFVRAVVTTEYDDIGDLIDRSGLRFRSIGTWSGIEDMAGRCNLFHDLDVCVVERYVIYPGRAQAHIGDDLYTARQIGMVEWLVHEHSLIGVVFQAASQAKQRWPDKRVCRYLPEVPGFGPHVTDAVRHLLTYLETQ